MQEFLLLMKGDDSAEISPEEMQQRMQGYMSWMQKIAGDGTYVDGQPLQPSGNHLINKETVITDGPFLEPKEIIGGYIIIKANDLDAATEIAKTCPLLEHCEIYVRPLMNAAG